MGGAKINDPLQIEDHAGDVATLGLHAILPQCKVLLGQLGGPGKLQPRSQRRGAEETLGRQPGQTLRLDARLHIPQRKVDAEGHTIDKLIGNQARLVRTPDTNDQLRLEMELSPEPR
ncbi:hypothetical protein D3C75_818320 [compost metagenome]